MMIVEPLKMLEVREEYELVIIGGGIAGLSAATVIDASGDGDVCHAAGEETAIYEDNRKAGWYYSFTEPSAYQLNLVHDALSDIRRCCQSSQWLIRDKSERFYMSTQKHKATN